MLLEAEKYFENHYIFYKKRNRKNIWQQFICIHYQWWAAEILDVIRNVHHSHRTLSKRMIHWKFRHVLNLNMDQHMSFHVTLLGEILWTYRTTEGLFSCMNASMSFKIIFFLKRLITDVASMKRLELSLIFYRIRIMFISLWHANRSSWTP